MAKVQRLYLLDGMALAYRAYYAFIQRPLVNSKGENTSAIYGFVTFLNRILSQEYPDYLAVVFDTAAPTFRHKAYKEYKATRQKMPEDMIRQLPILKEIVRAYNIPVVEVDGFEADDVIGTLAKQAEKEKALTFLVTGDKDFMQLVSERIKIYRPGRQGDDAEILGYDEVKQKFGVSPDKVVEVLGLTGDSSDNVPGVPGVGERTAIPLVQRFGSIKEIYENIDKIPQKGLKAKLEANKELALLSKKLVTIDTNVPLTIDFHSLKADKRDTAKLVQLFEALEFKSLVNKLRQLKGEEIGEAVPTAKTTGTVVAAELSDMTKDEHSYHLIADEKELREFCFRLSKAREFVFDTETTSTDALNAELVGISFSLEPHKAYFVAVSAPPTTGATDLFGGKKSRGSSLPHGLPADLVCKELKAILENSKTLKIGHNLKYDMLVLGNYDVSVQGDLFDTMVASYVLRADGTHNMDDCAKRYLGYKTVSYSDLTGAGKEQKHIRDVALQALSDYSCEDADITFRLYEVFKQKLGEEHTDKLCREVEFPLVSVLARMERTGVGIDFNFLSGMSKELDRELDNLTKEIYKISGETFNINSTQQLSEILFQKFKLNPVRKTKTGFSTDVAVLEALRHEHPIIEKLLDYRQLSKLKSTYVDALPKLVNSKTGRVHTSFNQTVAATGRLSSSDPNLQNIPIRTEIGRSIRKAFIPGDKHSMMMSADYSQIELRVMAHVCGDEGMSQAFHHKEDIHATTAAKVFGVSSGDVTRDMRRKAKEVNFGIMYGIGPFGLANRLEITQTEAKEIISKYFERFPKVKQYINDTIEKARKDGYVSTILGRRRYFPDIKSANQNIRQNAERQAINMPIQGSAADMIKLAMVQIDRQILKEGLKSSMILQVHDELVFEVKKTEAERVKKLVEKNMREALPLSVPIEVEVGVGKNWLEAH